MTERQEQNLIGAINLFADKEYIGHDEEVELLNLVAWFKKLSNQPYWEIWQNNPNGRFHVNENLGHFVIIQCPEQCLESACNELDIDLDGRRWSVYESHNEPSIYDTPLAQYKYRDSFEDNQIVVYHFDGRKDFWNRVENHLELTRTTTHNLFN